MDLDCREPGEAPEIPLYRHHLNDERGLSRDQSSSSTGLSKAEKPAVLAEDVLPFEVKRLIYDYADLRTFRSLRLVSNSWAAAGLEVLLLPTFFVRSSSVDGARLKAIGASATVSSQAAHIVRKLVFQNNDWDPKYLRSIVLSRHEHRRHYEPVDFVPTRNEQDALEELDLMIERNSLDSVHESDEGWLISALRHVPRVQSIQIVCRNPFQHRILRKVWEEYALETYQSEQLQNQLFTILAAVSETGLNVRNLSHAQLTSSFFAEDTEQVPGHVYSCLNNLQSLSLVISDLQQNFSTSDETIRRLRQLISSAPMLESLSIKFEALLPISLDFLPDPAIYNLHTLSLVGICLEPIKLFSFLGENISTLRRLKVGVAEIPTGHGSWRSFFEDLRDKSNLEKFQIYGMTRALDQDTPEAWLFWPIYNDEWEPVTNLRNTRTKEIEDFVVRGGAWPMVDSDDVSNLL